MTALDWNDSDNQALKKALHSPAALVFLLSIIGYLATYAFEAGYIGSYGLSPQFVQVQLSSFLFGAFAGLPIFFMIAGLADKFIGFHGRYNKDNPIHRRLKRAVLVTGATSIYFFPAVLITQDYWLLLLVLIYPVIEIVWPIISHPRTKGYASKIIKDERVEGPKIANSAVTFWISRALIYVVILAALSYLVGWYWAASLSDVDIIQDQSGRYIIVRDYGSELLTVKVNNQYKGSSQYKIFVIGGNNSITFSKQKLKAR